MTFTGKWPTEHDDALKEFFARGLSFAKIAAEINARFRGASYSRNACIGRAHRLGLTKADKPKAKVKRPRNKCTPAIRRAALVIPPPVPVCAVPAPDKPWPLYAPLGKLRECMCRWPYGDRAPYSFCAAATERGRPYCPPHEQMSLGTGTHSERSAQARSRRC